MPGRMVGVLFALAVMGTAGTAAADPLDKPSCTTMEAPARPTPDVPEEIAECQRQIALHPAKALHHMVLARLLIASGAGQAARREARKAVELEPTNSIAIDMLGWALSNDSLGREYMFDWDRAGALAVLRKARQLKRADAGTLIILAGALERQPDGRKAEAVADLTEAAEALRAAVAMTPFDEGRSELAEVLAALGKFAEAEQLVRGNAPAPWRNSRIVAFAAGRGGVSAARAAAEELAGSDSSQELLDQAATYLIMIRHYDTARGIYADTGGPTDAPDILVHVLDKLTPAPRRRAPADPEAAVRDLVRAVVEPDVAASAFWDGKLKRSVHDAPDAYVSRELVRMRDREGAYINDIAQAAISVAVTGDAGLWRAAVQGEGSAFEAYVALDRGVAKVVGTSVDPSGVGRFILRGDAKPDAKPDAKTDAKTDARAQRLLDWVAGDLDQYKRHKLSSDLWGTGVPATHDAILLAAAALARETDPQRVIPIAERCNSTMTGVDLVCHDLLSVSYLAVHRWADAAAQFDVLVQRKPSDAHFARFSEAEALAFAGPLADADHVFDEVLATFPTDYDALFGRYEAAVIAGQAAEIKLRANALLQHPKITPTIINAIAWDLFGQGDLPAALTTVHEALEMASHEPDALNTQAAIEAASGDLSHAIADNQEAMKPRYDQRQPPNDADWYVSGLIFEQLGLRDDAIAAYRRIINAAPEPSVYPSSVYAYAQKRLAALAHH